jgi:NifU-like protein involved in Fe-S cluster formation
MSITGKILKSCNECNNKFKCTYEDCEKTCSNNSDLQKHIKSIHDKIKDFKCDIEGCKYECSNNTHLQHHIKTVHDKIKDFKCDIEGCKYQCNTSSHLKQHIKSVHDKIKDFKCERVGCKYQCSSSSLLRQHIKVCTGDRNCSSGEFKIIETLESFGFEEEVDFYFDSTYEKLTSFCNKNLRLDFRMKDFKIFIEYDGEQHFKPKTFGGMSEEQALKEFENTKINDTLKDNFSEKFGYKMIRISYKEFDNIEKILLSELSEIM